MNSNESAFPRQNIESKGITKLEYFMTCAPKDPLWDYEVPMSTPRPDGRDKNRNEINHDEIQQWDKIYRMKKYAMWPRVWAEAVLSEMEELKWD